MKTCQPQVLELMTNHESGLIACAKAHSSTIGGACEKFVEKMTSNGLAGKLIDCGQDFLSICPTETMGLVASETVRNKVDWVALRKLTKCLGKKKKEVAKSQMCQSLLDSLKQEEKDDDPNYDDYAYADSGNKGGHDDDDDHGGKAGAVIGVMALVCVCAGGIGVGYWKRVEIKGMINGRSRPAPGAWRDFDIEEQSAGLTGTTIASTLPAPPDYAVSNQDDAKNGIVTANVIA